ncbi:hypothetical protein GYMLUDRAFT_427185 [Collybiopsis luxurians FD-317 M1]|uniref:Uncharacterized protein n=1 Tax=Collybiopsis luxurians FD-317 M1 TaxID=944289 RepID=A0A0D0D406_9AGAR|nr:hypothetical protein GYMLUDRAFT_427185 [Collybiopsis luxurians FD-317 M1]
MLFSSSQAILFGSFHSWSTVVPGYGVRHFSRSSVNLKDLSIGKISFPTIANLQIHKDQPPINLLSKYKIERLRPSEGHIYYHVPEGRPSLISELRFRMDNGVDYRLPNRIPWSIPIWRIVKNPDLAPLKELLIQDSIVTPEYIERCERFFPAEFATVAPNRVIYGLRQPFPIHTCRNKTTLWVVGDDKVLDLNIGSSWLGHPATRQKNHLGVTMAVLDFNENGYTLEVVKEPPLASVTRHRTIYVGRKRTLRCYSLTTPDYLPILEELVGR